MDALTTFIVFAVGLTLVLLVVTILLLALAAILAPINWFLETLSSLLSRIYDWSVKKLGSNNS